MATSPKRKTGDIAEEQALSHLTSAGCKKVEKNFNCRFGEIDLIMQDKDYLVFVEVRYRGKENFGSGAETISFSKQSKIIRTAQYYLQKKKIGDLQACRFDVVSITLNKEKQFKINWIKNAFQLG